MKRTPITRKTPLKPSNPARKHDRFRRAFGSKARVEMIRREPCAVCRSTPSENAHVRSRGAGGTWEDVIPLCPWHHREQHTVGLATFAARHQIALETVARWYAEHYPPEGL
jgi:hypothetical protein